MFFKNKLKFTLLITTGISYAVLPIVNVIEASNNMHISYFNFQTQGFDLIAPAFSDLERNIVENAFYNSDIPTAFLEEPSSQKDSYLRVSSRSKLHVYNDFLALNFYELNSNNKESIIVTNFIDGSSSSHPLPEGTSRNGVTHAQLIDNYLWLILRGRFNESTSDNYALQVYELVEMETGKPIFNTLTEPIELNYSLPTNPPSHLSKDLVLTPVYKLIDNEIVLDPLQMYVWEQNTAFTNFDDPQTGLRRFYIDSTNQDLTIESELSIIADNLLNNNAIAMSLFALTTSSDSKEKPASFALYHSRGIANTEIYLTTFKNFDEKIDEFLIDDNIDIEAANDLANQLSYPKADFSADGGIELFWIFPKNFVLNQPATTIFSNNLKMENDSVIMIDETSFNPISLTQGIEFHLISYQNYGSFKNGAYIPVKFKSNNGIFDIPGGTRKSGLINWKNTDNVEYWSAANFLEMGQSSLADPVAQTVNFEEDSSYINLATENGQYSQATMFIRSVDVNLNDIQYVIYQDFASSISQPNLLEQSRKLTDLKLNYNTSSLDHIHHKIPWSIWKKPVSNTLEEIQALILEMQKEIFNYTIDLKGIGNQKPIFSSIVINPEIDYFLSSENDQLDKVNLKFQYGNGTFIDGVLEPLTSAPEYEVTLQRQPDNGYPIEFNLNHKASLLVKADDIVAKFDAVLDENGALPLNWQTNEQFKGLIGFENTDIIQVTDFYLPYLQKIDLESNDFTGVLDLKFTFNTNFPGSRDYIYQFSISGFYAIQYVIAIVIPIAIILIIGSVLLFIYFQSRKKKSDITKAFTIGMQYNEKINQDVVVPKIEKLTKPIDNQENKKNLFSEPKKLSDMKEKR